MGGLMHLAGVLADGVLPSLTLESLERSYAPKAGDEAVWILGPKCQRSGWTHKFQEVQVELVHDGI